MKLKQLEKQLSKFIKDLKLTLIDKSIHLEGKANSWDDVVKAGTMAVSLKTKGVVNDIYVEGLEETPMYIPKEETNQFNNEEVDVLVIGAGVIGCSIANELSKYNLKTIVLDKENDVAMRTSSRNDGMIHPGIDIKPGAKKAMYNSRGNRLYTTLSKELNFKFKRNGSYVLFDKSYYKFIMPLFHKRAKQNGVDGVIYQSKKDIAKKERYVASWQKGGIFLPSSGIVCPYEVTTAFAEHAIENGVKFYLNTYVKDLKISNKEINTVQTNRGSFKAKIIINAAGVYADRIAQMADDRFFSIHPRKGTEFILDKKVNYITESVLAKIPFSDIKNHTKGGGIVRTIDGNILVGPNAIETIEREDDSTCEEVIDQLLEKHSKTVPLLNKRDIITYFSGTRAATYEEDFIIEKSEKINNLIHAAGIQSPGLTAAPAIAEDIRDITLKIFKDYYKKKIEKNKSYNKYRKTYPILSELKENEKNELIKKNPDYGKIICRCEQISLGEIKDCLNRPLKVYTVDAIKRRCRAGMGRCQGGFCSPTIASIISKKTGKSLDNVEKGRGHFCDGNIKE